MTERPDAPVQILTDDQPVACTRCGDDGLLAVRVPRGWHTAAGAYAEGSLNWVLCSRCDRERPGAAALITFFDVHGRVEDPAVLSEFSRLVHLWIGELEAVQVDPEAFEADLRAWRNGEFD